MAHWTENRYPGYEEVARKTTYARDHYEATVREKVERSVVEEANRTLTPGSNIIWTDDSQVIDRAGKRTNERAYLVQKSQGEHEDSFHERARLSRFPRHMGKVVGAFLGALGAQEAKTVRRFDAEHADVPPEAHAMSSYWQNVDGSGTSWMQMLSGDAARLIVEHSDWSCLLPPAEGDESGMARLRFYRPENVLNYYPSDGRPLEWVLFREIEDTRSDPKSEQERSERVVYRLVTLEGMERFVAVEDEVMPLDSVSWSQPFYTDATMQTRRVPVTLGQLQLGQTGDAHVGYSIAQDANYLYNLLSDIRQAIRTVTHNKLAGDVTDTQFSATRDSTIEGSNLLQGAWGYIGPDPAYTTASYEIYRDEVRDFFITSFQEYEDRARERTATEVDKESARGWFSFLSLVAVTMDQVETDRMFLIAQQQHPGASSEWKAFATVKRSHDFKPIDAHAEGDRLTNKFFPAGIALTVDGMREALSQATSALGVTLEQEALEGAALLNAALTILRMNPAMGLEQAIRAAQGEAEQLVRTDFTNGVEQ